MIDVYDFVEKHRSSSIGYSILICVILYLVLAVPGSGLSIQTITVRVITMIFSGWVIMTTLFNVILLSTIQTEEWEKLGKFPSRDLKGYVWIGIILGFAIPIISIISAFDVYQLPKP
jgi:hypothetical protein